jgi:hypothetical protein
MNVIGEVQGRTAVIIDDEINTGGSLIDACTALTAEGAREIYSCSTHGIFSGDALEKIDRSPITEVIVTNTIPLPEGAKRDRVKVLSVGPLFGEAIRRIHRGESVGALFTSERRLTEELTFWDPNQLRDDTEEAPFPLTDTEPAPGMHPEPVGAATAGER